MPPEQREPDTEQRLDAERDLDTEQRLDAERDLESERRRLVEEKKNERYVWWYLAYFLFGIHLVAFVMIYAVMHAK
jgi:hypothetical protein